MIRVRESEREHYFFDEIDNNTDGTGEINPSQRFNVWKSLVWEGSRILRESSRNGHNRLMGSRIISNARMREANRIVKIAIENELRKERYGRAP